MHFALCNVEVISLTSYVVTYIAYVEPYLENLLLIHDSR